MIALANDHAGTKLKNIINLHLKKRGFETKDFGTFDEQSCDYPDFALKAALAVKNGECEKGILICGTGIGISISANKVKGIRCALCTNLFGAEMTRLHNDSNMLALGARVTEEDLALQIVDKWLETNFEGGRHQLRIDKITNIENEFSK